MEWGTSGRGTCLDQGLFVSHDGSVLFLGRNRSRSGHCPVHRPLDRLTIGSACRLNHLLHSWRGDIGRHGRRGQSRLGGHSGSCHCLAAAHSDNAAGRGLVLAHDLHLSLSFSGRGGRQSWLTADTARLVTELVDHHFSRVGDCGGGDATVDRLERGNAF